MKSTKQIFREYFTQLGKKRFTRIALCTLVIGLLWCGIDLIQGNLSVNLMHDLICLLLGVVTERIIPWGKRKQPKETLEG